MERIIGTAIFISFSIFLGFAVCLTTGFFGCFPLFPSIATTGLNFLLNPVFLTMNFAFSCAVAVMIESAMRENETRSKFLALFGLKCSSCSQHRHYVPGPLKRLFGDKERIWCELTGGDLVSLEHSCVSHSELDGYILRYESARQQSELALFESLRNDPQLNGFDRINGPRPAIRGGE